MAGSCSTASGAGAGGGGGGGGGGGEFMLFGVRVVVDSMRKSVSLNNLSQYELPPDSTTTAIKEDTKTNKEDAAAAVAVATGYASADDAVPHSSSSAARSERKRGVPWTEEEHKLFLLGLQKVGKGDWRGISRNFVKTRTPTQVASHAQKYFLRRSNINRRRRRSSLFDITTDTVSLTVPMEEEQAHNQDNNTKNTPQTHPLPTPQQQQLRETSNFPSTPVFSVATTAVAMPVSMENPPQGSQYINHSTSLVHPVPVVAASRASVGSELDLNLTVDPSPLSLKLSSSPSDQMESSSRHSVLQMMSSFSNGDSGIISVA